MAERLGILTYERAGATFKGQMRQNFVLLTDKGVRMGGSHSRGGAGGPAITGANKRGRENEKDPKESKRQAWSNAKGPRGARGCGNGQGRGKPNAHTN